MDTRTVKGSQVEKRLSGLACWSLLLALQQPELSAWPQNPAVRSPALSRHAETLSDTECGLVYAVVCIGVSL